MLGIIERSERFGRVDGDFAFLIDHLRTVAPQKPMGIIIAVTDRLAMRESGWRIVGFHGLAKFEKARGIFREFAEAGFLHMAVAIDNGIADRRQRHGNELVLTYRIAFQAIVEAAIFSSR